MGSTDYSHTFIITHFSPYKFHVYENVRFLNLFCEQTQKKKKKKEKETKKQIPDGNVRLHELISHILQCLPVW